MNYILARVYVQEGKRIKLGLRVDSETPRRIQKLRHYETGRRIGR